VEWEGGSAFQQRKGSVSDLVDWEVLSNGCPRCFPHEGAEGWVQLDQEGTVTLWGAIGGTVRN